MDKLKFIPHKNLFYFGSIVVFIFLILSYWQFDRYQTNKKIAYNDTNQELINIDEINLTNSESFIKLNGAFRLVDYYKLRSRVYNGTSGYHIVAIYRDENNIHLTVNHGWIPLENARFEIGNFRYGFDGFILNYDTKSPIGQDDKINSEYIFRIDKSFIEKDQIIELSNKYVHLTSNCGVGIECAPLNTGYKPPHMSYSIQWLFFAVCLSIVILRKNKLI